ncbi:MAG: N-formylglutamate amidohydrolase [Methylocystaceae bacterium]|nr:N-formylglutamate amidohydrolase [Methylocystaceae bacterium]
MSEAFEIYNENGSFPLLLVCEHASNYVPSRYNGLGLDEDLLQSHIAWDPGARQVALKLADMLDCPLVAAGMSRLLYDCNRPPEAKDSIPVLSEIYPIPGNVDLTSEEKNWRIENIYQPFHSAVENTFSKLENTDIVPSMVTIHSFTPVYKGEKRKVEIGILHDSDTALADHILDASSDFEDLVIARNEPYSPTDGVTHSLKLHGLNKGRRNVMFEIRNDLISNENKAADMAARLAPMIKNAVLNQSSHKKPGEDV